MALDPWSYAAKGSEHAEQTALFMWANMAANYGIEAANDPKCYNEKGYVKYNYCKWPIGCDLSKIPQNSGPEAIEELDKLFAIHNQGHGDAVRGARAAAEGLKKGVPDICLPVAKPHLQGPVGGIVCWEACGLYIELKRRKTNSQAKGRASDSQNEWIDFLRQQGYVCVVCYGWEEARETILKYLYN